MIKKLAINFSALSLLQLSNYLFPLITFPYLVRILGPANFGFANFAFAFLVYFNAIIDYGFHFSATREIARSKSNGAKINQLFNLTFFSKLALLTPVTILYFIIITLIPFFNEHFTLYVIAYFSIIGNMLFPLWFFQGIEKMFYVTSFNILFRTMGVVAIFLFVINEADLIYYMIITSAVSFITGAVSIVYVFKRKLILVALPKIENLKNHLRSSFNLFSSQYLIMLYTSSNTFVLGVIGGSLAVGLFSAADKIRLAVQNIGGIAGQTVFPHVSNLFKNSNTSAVIFLNKYSKILGASMGIISLVVFVYSTEIIQIVLGAQYVQSIIILKILSFLPVIIFFSNVFGIQFMLGKGYDKEFSKIILTGAILNLILLIVLVPKYGAEGTAFSMLITEVVITLSTFIFFVRHKHEIYNQRATNHLQNCDKWQIIFSLP